MKEYIVNLEFYGRKTEMTVNATSIEHAKELIKDKINFYSITENINTTVIYFEFDGRKMVTTINAIIGIENAKEFVKNKISFYLINLIESKSEKEMFYKLKEIFRNAGIKI